MTRGTRVQFVLLAVFFAGWSGSALAGNLMIHSSWTALGISSTLATVISGLEMVTAIGLLLGGLRFPLLACASSAGAVMLMIGALSYHVRAGDGFAAHGSVVVLIASSFAFVGSLKAVPKTRVSLTPAAEGGTRRLIVAWDSPKHAGEPISSPALITSDSAAAGPEPEPGLFLIGSARS